MPELPEVETMVRGVRPYVKGRTVSALVDCGCTRRPLDIRPDFPTLAKRLTGATIEDVRRLGKRVVFDLNDGANFVLEPRMTGLVLLTDPPSPEHLRLEWRLAGKGEYSRFWYWDRRGLGTVRLYKPGELNLRLEAGFLGPDALSLSAADWRTLCAATSRPIKLLLLDQKRAAGVGNLYASEILHKARIDPRRPANELTRPQVTRMHAALQAVLLEAIEYEGSTLGDGTYRNALNKYGGYQNVHRVYMKAKQPCRSCKRGVVERIVQAQRSTFFCPACQR